MRVITGSARGHTLKMPGGGKTRPAMDMVKGSLFSILGARVPDCRFLDLFAGSGSLGIEALSRGAAWAVFVDTSIDCVKTIQDNLKHTKLTERAKVYRMDCRKFLTHCHEEPFDLVCIDPPYSKGLLAPILDLIPTCPLFTPATRFIIERERKDDLGLPDRPALELLDEREYGATVLTFFRLRPTVTPGAAPGTPSAETEPPSETPSERPPTSESGPHA
jgi:16S rRNA (guanine966-N2)-methyltransferase